MRTFGAFGRFRAPVTRVASAPLTVQVAARDGATTHCVTDVEMAAVANDRPVRAVCGLTFVPAGLTVPHGPRCARCLSWAMKAAPDG